VLAGQDGWVDLTTIIDPGRRDVIDVQGDEALTYLQGQLSQDVGSLVADQPVWSLLLEPTGKLGSWIRVTRLGEPGHLEIDVDPGSGPAVLERLNRFKLRSQVTFELRAGPAGGFPRVDDEAEAIRVEAGVPRMGAEITGDVIPAELGQWLIDASVDFNKGCYTGQELVARIDSRGGNVPRHLRGLVFEGAETPPVGAEVVVGDEVVGALTSVARSPELGVPIALAFVRRKVEPPAEAVVRAGERIYAAQIRSLPLVGPTPA
jgi:tRNA-modifying protein YgfZ